jgi:chitodextrinase
MKIKLLVFIVLNISIIAGQKTLLQNFSTTLIPNTANGVSGIKTNPVLARSTSNNTVSKMEPCSGTSITTYPYTETFDSGIGDWVQGSGDDGNWTLNSGGTPTGGTGPSDDISGGGNYFYTEANNNQDPGPNATVYLESPCFDLSNYVNVNFAFNYHMRGNNMGTLSLEASDDDGMSWTELFSLSGSQGNQWNLQNLDLSAYDGSVIKLRFVGATGSGRKSDMAIDQTVLTGDVSDSEPPTAPTNLAATNIIDVSTDLSWTAATDNVGVTEYDVYQDALLIATVTEINYQVTGLSPNTTYAFSVIAKDLSGNESTPSNTVNITTTDLAPCSGTSITTYPYTETFDSGIGDWVQGSGDDGIWTLNSGGTPSGGTGPSDDITGGGNYFYTEANNNQDPGQNATVYIESPCFDLSNYINANLAFNYHMRGNNMGTLSLEASDDDGMSWTELFSLSGNQGNQWNLQNLDLSTYDGRIIKLRFVGVTGGGNRSDMAFDQIVLTADLVELEPPTAPTNLMASNITQTTIDLSWTASTDNVGVVAYDIYIDNSLFDTSLGTGTTYQAIGLTPNTLYALQLVAKDVNGNESEFSNTVSVFTLEVPLVYCTSTSQLSNEEFISRVQINTIDNASGSQLYSDFTSISTDLSLNSNYTISITPTWTGISYDEGYAVWIDYNVDGDFTDAGELVWSQAPSQTTTVTGDFSIPLSASLGETRMRVSMKYNGIPTSCESFVFGEVEDYTVNIMYDGLLFSSNLWAPNAPSNLTGSSNALVLDGTHTIASDANLNNLIVNSGAALEIEEGQSLTLAGTVQNLGSITLNSISQSYSSLIVEGNVTGNVIYRRHVNIRTNGNDLISAPVTGETFSTFAGNNANLFENPVNTTEKLFGPFDKTTDTYLTYDTAIPVEANVILEPGIGYRAASTDNSTFSFEGVVNTGDINVNIVNSGPTNPEWNLIGNPYPSYITALDFLTLNESQFDPLSFGVYGYDGDAASGWTILNKATAEDALIAPGQGFLVASVPGGGTMAFTPSMRTNGDTEDFIIGAPNSVTNEISNAHVKLNINSSTDEASYFTDFYFTNNATLGLDPGYDAGAFGGTSPNFSIYSQLVEDNDGRDMAIQAIHTSDLNNDVRIPLGINATQGQQLRINIETSTLPEDVNVYLEDNELNTFTLLNDIDFTLTSTTNLSGIGRFFLRFESEALSAAINTLERLNIYAINTPKLLFVNGQLNEKTNLTIYDVQGRKVLSKELRTNAITQQIELSNIMTGVYVVALKNSMQTISKKIIIN